MLDIYSVAFFGHRHIEDAFAVSENLKCEIRRLLSAKEYVEFLVGRNGEFDTLAASGVRCAKKEYRSDNSALVLVLPYATAEYRNNERSFSEYYDEIEICNEADEAYFKSAIGIRNRKMVERADCIICHIERPSGGAYAAVEYAKSLGKKIVEI